MPFTYSDSDLLFFYQAIAGEREQARLASASSTMLAYIRRKPSIVGRRQTRVLMKCGGWGGRFFFGCVCVCGEWIEERERERNMK